MTCSKGQGEAQLRKPVPCVSGQWACASGDKCVRDQGKEEDGEVY